ncbi:MAG TPA: hypothetical protein VFN71_02995, partial [Methylomirabilota bacterium]|nr:hypothetical protein [Methylomirabilota bacterium]
GWGEIFKDLKSQGLVTDRNLGQAISRYNHTLKPSSQSGTMITSGAGRTQIEGAASRSNSVAGAEAREEHGRVETERGDHGRGGGSSASGTSASAGTYSRGDEARAGSSAGASAGRGGGYGGGRGK